MSTEANPHLPEVLEIIERVEQKDPSTNALLAAQRIVDLGFFLIGTAQSQEVHEPTVQTYYEKDYMQDCAFGDDPNKPLVQATWAGSLAIQSALLGDWNVKDQRRVLGDPLTDQRYLYGWKTSGVLIADLESETFSLGIESELYLHAERALLQAVKRRGSNLTGSIDIADGSTHDFTTPVTAYEDEQGKYHVIDRPGIVICYGPVTTVATLPVTGPDLWLTNISSQEYDQKS